MIIPKQVWQQARDAVCLGATLQDVAEAYGINYGTLKDRARKEQWPRPDKLPPPPPSLKAPLVASKSLAQRGEAHKLRIAELVEQALASALPPALNNWQDIERAAKLGNQAFGLDERQAPLVSLAFPASLSTEVPAFIDISTNSRAEARRDELESGEADQ